MPVTKLCFVKTKKNNKTKNIRSRFLECLEQNVFEFPKQIGFESVFVCFFDEGKSYFECI